MSVAERPGNLGQVGYSSGGSVDFEWVPRPAHSFVVAYVTASTNGKVEIFRRARYPSQVLREIGVDSVQLSAGEEVRIECPRPVAGSLLVRFTDESSSAGIASVETVDDGGL